MKIDSWQKLVMALMALFIGFNLPELWEMIKNLFS